MTPAGFPHSEILGSQLGWQLPEAYRSLLRPSSAPGAKASTVCPYYLDGELLPRPKARSVLNAAAPEGTDSANTLLFGSCAVFKLHRGRRTEVFGSRSLKTEQRSEATSRHEAESPPSGTSGRH